ncbi:MAG: hypothetical protein HGA75_05015 [Thiobacillus sp.]|nr:hypothetical protein [Thiobacillus sp.]
MKTNLTAPFLGFLGAVLVAMTVLLLAGCASDPASSGMKLGAARPAPVAVSPDPLATAAASGIRVDGLHLSAHGYILDLRYRVLDPAKAKLLLDAKKKVTLVDEAHGAQLGVPQSPVIGGMRQTSRNYAVYTDRDYFILFVNPGRAVKAGDTLKLAVDGTRIADVTVQ